MPDLRQIAAYAAGLYGIPQGAFVAQLDVESGFQNLPGGAGEQGIGQFMPGTWTDTWNKHPELSAHYGNLSDPSGRNNNEASIFAAAALMSDLYKQAGGDYRKALYGYNAGPGRMNNPPASTVNYANSIMGATGADSPTLGGVANAPGSQGAGGVADFFGGLFGGGGSSNGGGNGGLTFVTGPGGRIFAMDEYGVVSDYNPDTGGGGGEYHSPEWRPGELELEQQGLADSRWYDQQQAQNAAQQNANDLYLGQQGAQNDAQQNADWYAINDRQNQLTQRDQDLAQKKADADRAVDWYSAISDNQNRQLAEQHQWQLGQAQLQLDNDKAQWQRDYDLLTNATNMRGQDIDMRGQDIGALTDQMNAGINREQNYMDYNLGLGQLGLGAVGAETDRYSAEADAQLGQQGNMLDFMGMNLDAEAQYNNSLIAKYQQDIAAYRAIGDEQNAQATEQRLIAAQNQNSALEWMRIMNDANQSSTGLGGAANAATQLATGLGGIEQQRNEMLTGLAANPRDWVQLQYALGNDLGDILSGVAPGAQSVMNIGDDATLGAGFDQLMGQLNQRPDLPLFQQASDIISRLADWSSDPTHGGQMPSLQDILNIGQVSAGGVGGQPLPQLQGPDLQGPQQYSFPGLNLDPNWSQMPQFGQGYLPEASSSFQMPGYVGAPDMNQILTGMPNPYSAQLPMPPAGSGYAPIPTNMGGSTAVPGLPSQQRPGASIGAGPGSVAPVGGPAQIPMPSPTTPTTPVGGGPYDPNDPQHTGPGQYDMSHPGAQHLTLPDGTPYRRDPSGGGEIDKPGYEPGLLLSNEQNDILNRARKNTKGYTGPDWHGTPKKVNPPPKKKATTKKAAKTPGYSPAAQAILDKQKARK